MRTHRHTAKILTTALISGLTLIAPATAAHAATCWYGACYSYVYGRQDTNVTGAVVTMDQATPGQVASNGHSLQELSLQNSAQTDTVEVGWTVDPTVNGDYLPHLFVYHWVDGQESCYNGCGFVQVSATLRPGMPVASGTSADYGLAYVSGDWEVLYNGAEVGYFPGSLWGGAFTTAQVVTAFGEVASASSPGCTDMGDGVLGSAGGSSWIADYRLYGTGVAPDFTVTDTDPGLYDYGSVTPTSFHLGGPGDC